jgi:predicted extracellular nuclease
MLVTIPQMLYATDNYNLGQYGEVLLSVSDRLDIPTNMVEPGPAAQSLQDLNNRSSIQLDDASGESNPLPLPPYLDEKNTLRAGDTEKNTLRAGDTIPSLTGLIGYAFGAYEIHPQDLTQVEFTRNDPRPAASPAVGGSMKVASFNVLNYFTTIDDGDPICGPFGGMGCRGADTDDEFTRQRNKIISAILAMDADVIGLMEMENHPTDAALQDLVSGLNEVSGNGSYDLVDTGPVGTDAIKVAFIYKPSSVSTVGPYAILDSSWDPDFIDTKNRPVIVQTFQQNGTDDLVTVAVNHLKSKGSSCNDIGDPDLGDGQGNCNLTRTKAASVLVNWLATDPTGSSSADFLIIGDLNSYAMEDPIDAIKAAGYLDLVAEYGGIGAYSYVYFGQAGYLDHALSNPSLATRVTGTEIWHINADEPNALNYNDYNQPDLYHPDPFRSSDHDPVVVGICEATPPVVDISLSADTLWPVNHKYTEVTAIVDVTDADPNPIVELVSVISNQTDDGFGDGKTTDDIDIVDDFTFMLRAERSGKDKDRVYTITYRITDACGNTTIATATVTVPHDKAKK